MKHIDNLRTELNNLGFTDYDLEEVEVTRNAVLCRGIRVINLNDPAYSPIVYYSPEETMSTVLERIVAASNTTAPEFPVANLTDPKYVASHLYLAISKRDGEGKDVVKRRYLNVDLFMKLIVDGNISDSEVGTVRVTGKLLESAGITEEDAWDFAFENSRKTVEIKTLFSVISAMIGIDPEEEPSSGPEMFVGMCNAGYDGAAILAMPEVFHEFCEQNDYKALYILPSSTMELILLPNVDSFSVAELLKMNAEITMSEVNDPMIRLDPAVYQYTVEGNSVSIVTTMEQGV